MTSYKKMNKFASMEGFYGSYKSNLEVSRMTDYRQKFPHVKYIRAWISYQRRQ